MARIAIIALLLLATSPALAEPAQPDAPPADAGAPTPPAAAAPAEQNAATPPAATPPPSDADLRESVCLMIEASARAHNLPLEFFARVIWQESRFQPGVVGPRTRSGERAQGIAQFMPRTAAERGLLDPFDPVQALPKSAEFLRELADQFGNLGLAAAAYNAGPQRVRDWLSGRRTLPAETQNYVQAITGISADEWARSGKREPVQPARPNCTQLMALLHRAPNPFVQKLEERVNIVKRGGGGRQPVGRAARRRVLARPCAVELRDAGQALCRGADRTRPEPPQQRVPQPRHPAVLPGAGGRRDAPGGGLLVRQHPPRRRRLHRAAQRRELTGVNVGGGATGASGYRFSPRITETKTAAICTNTEILLAMAATTTTQRASCSIQPRARVVGRIASLPGAGDQKAHKQGLRPCDSRRLSRAKGPAPS